MPQLAHTARAQHCPPKPSSPAPSPRRRFSSLQRWFAAVTAAARGLSACACLTAHASRHAGRAAPARAGLLAVSAALLLATLLGAAGQARAAVLISNIDPGQSNGTTTDGLVMDAVIAQAFTTGSNAGGYTLESVEVVFEDPVPSTDISDFSVGVWTMNVMGNPSVERYALTNPASATARMPALFTAPTNATLDANTTYLVRVINSGSRAPNLFGTTSDGEEAGGAMGWSIADDARVFNSTTMSWSNDAAAAYIRINGAVRPPPDPGAPEITGAAQVGQTLTAGMGTIADTDGLPSTTFPTGYSFQWVRVMGMTETDITGATSRTYTLAAADLGRTVKVKVSFTDGGGNSEEPRAESRYSTSCRGAPCPG